MDNGMLPTLDGLRKAEDQNYASLAEELGETLQLASDATALYDWLAAELCKPGAAERCPEVVPGLSFLRASQYYLHAAALTCLRGHLAESFADTRMAIETVAVLAKMKRKPALAYLWIEAGADDEAAKKYRRETTGPEIFPVTDPALSDLKRHYDLCAKQTHPGFVSMVRRLRLGPQPLAFEFHWFDVFPESEAEPARTFLWISETHLKLLDLYGSIFKPAIEETGWTSRRDGFDASLSFNIEKWRATIIKEEGPYSLPEKADD